jgi:hypothetical protein
MGQTGFGRRLGSTVWVHSVLMAGSLGTNWLMYSECTTLDYRLSCQCR